MTVPVGRIYDHFISFHFIKKKKQEFLSLIIFPFFFSLLAAFSRQDMYSVSFLLLHLLLLILK